MKLFIFAANLSLTLLLASSCAKTDLVSPQPQQTSSLLLSHPITPLYLPHIDSVYEDIPGNYDCSFFVAGQRFQGNAQLFVDGSAWIDVASRSPSGTTPPQNEFAKYMYERVVPETATGVHVLRIQSGLSFSNSYSFSFTPQFNWEGALVTPGQIFDLQGSFFGNRTLPSRLQVFDVTNGQRRLLITPSIVSWNPKDIRMVIPKYTRPSDPFGIDRSIWTVQIELTVGVKTNTKNINYQL